MLLILCALVSFHALDGHIIWVNPAQVNIVRGGGQVGYPNGTLIGVGSEHLTVQENVNQVVTKLRETK